MPSVRTESQPMNAAASEAAAIATGTPIHHGHFRLISATALAPRIATR